MRIAAIQEKLAEKLLDKIALDSLPNDAQKDS
jgi:hypothetical protein